MQDLTHDHFAIGKISEKVIWAVQKRKADREQND